MSLSPVDVAWYAYEAGFRGDDLATAVAVAGAESSFNALDTNSAGNYPSGSVDRGLWQINDYWNRDLFALGDWRDPATNARMAFSAWSSAGWGDWTTYQTGAYRAHLDVARSAAQAVELGGAPAPAGAGARLASIATAVPASIGSALLAPVGKLVLTGLFVAGGVGLVVLGLYHGAGGSVRESMRRRADQGAQAAQVAAVAA